MSAQGQAHQDSLDAVDALQKAQESAADSEIRRASSLPTRAKREWHRLVRLAQAADRSRQRYPPISAQGGIHFGTVAPPDVGQRPTFGPESPLLWESSMLTVARSARRPTAVPKWIPLSAHMGCPAGHTECRIWAGWLGRPLTATLDESETWGSIDPHADRGHRTARVVKRCLRGRILWLRMQLDTSAMLR